MATTTIFPSAAALQEYRLAQNLYGVHDLESEWLQQIAVPSGASFWALSVHSIGSNPNDTSHDLPLYNPDPATFVQIARLNNAYNGKDGTFPVREPLDRHPLGQSQSYKSFGRRCAQFIKASQTACEQGGRSPCYNWIVGNEPNTATERPQTQKIEAEMAGEAYAEVWHALHNIDGQGIDVPNHHLHRLWLCGVAPYNVETGDWLTYQYKMMEVARSLYKVTPDAFTGHAYTRGSNPADISAPLMMDEPFQDRFRGFRTFEDLLHKGTPTWATALPFLITEFDEYVAWTDANTGVVKAAYAHINGWNQFSSNQPVQGLILYRYPNIEGDKWGFKDKEGVKTDLKEAAQAHYLAPLPKVFTMTVPPVPDNNNTLHIPWMGTNAGSDTPTTPPTQSPGNIEPNRPPLVWDDRLTQRGSKLVQYQPTVEGELYWALITGEYLDEKEHTFANTVDLLGAPLVGVELRWFWGGGGPSEQEIQKTKDITRDPYALGMANFAMYNPGPSYSLEVLKTVNSEIGGSDRITGEGLGTPAQPDWKIHRSSRYTFKLTRAGKATSSTPPSAPPPVQQQPVNPPPVPLLVYPLAFKTYPITQHYGEDPEGYKQFLYDGIPLRGHNGVDIGAPYGTPILAVDTGKILEAGTDPDKITGGLGNYVKIQHTWGESLYAHLATIGAGRSAGSFVNDGNSIGTVGATGNATGPHLHFAMRIYPYSRTDGMGGYSNPEPYLAKAVVAEFPGGAVPLDPSQGTGQGGANENWARVWPIVLDIEGNNQLSTDPNDPGNYRPDGTFVGSKYGISARAHPELDIPSLTQDQALNLYYTGYWLKSGAYLLQWPLCLLHFDAFVQNEVAAGQFLVQSLYNCIRYNALRESWYTTAPTWQFHGQGWIARVARLDKIVAEFFNVQVTQLPKS